MNHTDDNLLILWTTDNKDTAMNMVFMYAGNSKIRGWWKDVTLLIWGASSKMVAEDPDIQDHIRQLSEKGVRIVACRKCAENLDIVEKLEEQNIDVFYSGEFLSDWLKSGKKIIIV